MSTYTLPKCPSWIKEIKQKEWTKVVPYLKIDERVNVPELKLYGHISGLHYEEPYNRGNVIGFTLMDGPDSHLEYYLEGTYIYEPWLAKWMTENEYR